jgi:hypothetical protein
MAHVLLTSAAPENDSTWPYPYDELERMEASADADAFGCHHLTDDPDRADIILFVENADPIRHYFRLRGNAHFRRFPDKCFLFSRYDFPVPLLPGVYPSIPKRWHNKKRTRSGPYLNAFDDNFLYAPGGHQSDRYLYSFVGQKTTHSLRQQIFDLDHPRQFVFDTSDFWPYADLDTDAKNELEERYVRAFHQSRFILCPRGRGASSIRLYETLRMGRVPVIISDQWVPPDGPDWDAFSIRVDESNIFAIPSLLETYADRAAVMGMKARMVWETWFSKEATFHRVVEWCIEIQRERRFPEWLSRYRVLPQLARPLYFRALLRTVLPGRFVSLLRK